jgi:hypothetical protein
MSQTFKSPFLTVTTAGFSAATGAASASTAIPADGSGNLPNYIRVAATLACYVKLGTSGVASTNSDILVQPGDSVVLAVPKGITHIGYIQDAAAGRVSVVPMANS